MFWTLVYMSDRLEKSKIMFYLGFETSSSLHSYIYMNQYNIYSTVTLTLIQNVNIN